MDDYNSKNDVSALTARTHQFSTLSNSQDPYRKIRWAIFIVISLFVSVYWYYNDQASTKNSQYIIAHPKIDDVYYLDFRKFSDDLRPKEKYRFAKVIDITGDVVTLFFGNLYYPNEKSMVDGIRWGHLRFYDYFSSFRHNYSLQELKKLLAEQAIFKVERPFLGKLHSNYVNPTPKKISTNTQYIAGKQENIKGESFLRASNITNHLQTAFEWFTRSAQLNYPQGQINLAEMYLDTRLEKQDFKQALYWLEQASLQSNKAAINKYVIVCEKVNTCNINRFYQSLINAGVNIHFNNQVKPLVGLD